MCNINHTVEDAFGRVISADPYPEDTRLAEQRRQQAIATAEAMQTLRQEREYWQNTGDAAYYGRERW